jgi:hypothetical protein
MSGISRMMLEARLLRGGAACGSEPHQRDAQRQDERSQAHPSIVLT